MKKVALIILLGSLIALNLSSCRNPDTTSAKIYIQQNDLEKAAQSLQKALSTNPQDAEAHYLLGQVYSHQKNYPDMLKEFESTVALTKKYDKDISITKAKLHHDLYNGAVDLYNQKKYDEALESANSAALINPNDQGVFALLGRVYVKKTMQDEAITAFERATLLDPKYEFMDDHVLLMEFYYNRGNFEKALDKAVQILKIDPNQKDATRVAAFSYNSLGQAEKALEYYQKVLNDNPNNPDINFNMGWLYKEMQKYDEAIVCLKRTIELKADDIEALQSIAEIYLNVKNDNTNAVDYYRKAAVVQPDNPRILNNLGVALIRLSSEKNDDAKLREEGKAFIEKATKLSGK
jgi:protein O-GlcNAc transferase